MSAQLFPLVLPTCYAHAVLWLPPKFKIFKIQSFFFFSRVPWLYLLALFLTCFLRVWLHSSTDLALECLHHYFHLSNFCCSFLCLHDQFLHTVGLYMFQQVFLYRLQYALKFLLHRLNMFYELFCFRLEYLNLGFPSFLLLAKGLDFLLETFYLCILNDLLLEGQFLHFPASQQ